MLAYVDRPFFWCLDSVLEPLCYIFYGLIIGYYISFCIFVG